MRTKTLVLTSAAGPTGPAVALQAGAAGFLYKDVDPDALVRAIRSVHDGHTVLAPEAASLVAARPAAGVRGIAALTSREREVLALLADGRSNREIAQAAQRVGEDRQDARERGACQARRRRPDAGRPPCRAPAGLASPALRSCGHAVSSS